MPPERHPKSAPGPFYVLNGQCIFCKAPEAEAPDLMAHDDEPDYHCYFKKQPTTPQEWDQAISAVHVACCGAVRYAGTDPIILDRIAQWSPECCDHLLSDRNTLGQELTRRSGVARVCRFFLRPLLSALLGALGFALILGLFGMVASVLDHKPNLWWQVASFGAYIGALVGIGQGIKTAFGDSEPDLSGKEMATDVGKYAAGNLVPGLNAVLLLGNFIAWVRGARLGPHAGKKAILDGLAWSIFATGVVVLVYYILALDMGRFPIEYALLVIPAAAVIGAIRGAFSS